MGRSIDHVETLVARETIKLPWASRDALLGQFKHLDSMGEIARQHGAEWDIDSPTR